MRKLWKVFLYKIRITTTESEIVEILASTYVIVRLLITTTCNGGTKTGFSFEREKSRRVTKNIVAW